MADAQLLAQLTRNFFKRNNPVEMFVKSIQDTVYTVITFRSQMKLMKYRYILEQQKFKRIEGTLVQSNPYQSGQFGSKFNKRY